MTQQRFPISPITGKKINYLSNANLLKEIHLSKNSYCAFPDKFYCHYDGIVRDSIKNITDEIIAEAELKKEKRLTDFPNTPKKLIIRVMTHEHIKEHVIFSKNKVNYQKLKFPPFKHYVREGKRWKEVLKSHWQGDLKEGKFCQNHGNISNELAKMIMLLVKKYSMKWNWRNYTYRDDMAGEAMCHLCSVALKFDESKGNNPFAFYTQIITNVFKNELNIEKRMRNIRDDLLMQQGQAGSFARQDELAEAGVVAAEAVAANIEKDYSQTVKD